MAELGWIVLGHSWDVPSGLDRCNSWHCCAVPCWALNGRCKLAVFVSGCIVLFRLVSAVPNMLLMKTCEIKSCGPDAWPLRQDLSAPARSWMMLL